MTTSVPMDEYPPGEQATPVTNVTGQTISTAAGEPVMMTSIPTQGGAAVAPYPAKGLMGDPTAFYGREHDRLMSLRKWHWIMFVVYLLMAIIILPISAAIARGSLPMDTNFSVFDMQRRIYVNTFQPRGYYQPGGELCIFFFIDAFEALVVAIFFKKWVHSVEKYGTDKVRWLLWSISFAWLNYIVSISTGMSELLLTIIAIPGLTLCFVFFMMVQELINGPRTSRHHTSWWAWFFAFIPFVAIWIIQWVYLMNWFERNAVPKIIYSIVILTTWFLFTIWASQGLHFARVTGFRSYANLTKWYIFFNFLWKTVVGWLLFAFFIWLFYTVDSNLNGTGNGLNTPGPVFT